MTRIEHHIKTYPTSLIQWVITSTVRTAANAVGLKEEYFEVSGYA